MVKKKNECQYIYKNGIKHGELCAKKCNGKYCDKHNIGCRHIFIRGDKKGDVCGKGCRGDFCKEHKPKKIQYNRNYHKNRYERTINLNIENLDKNIIIPNDLNKLRDKLNHVLIKYKDYNLLAKEFIQKYKEAKHKYEEAVNDEDNEAIDFWKRKMEKRYNEHDKEILIRRIKKFKRLKEIYEHHIDELEKELKYDEKEAAE